jgi:hypothetical protein
MLSRNFAAQKIELGESGLLEGNVRGKRTGCTVVTTKTRKLSGRALFLIFCVANTPAVFRRPRVFA